MPGIFVGTIIGTKPRKTKTVKFSKLVSPFVICLIVISTAFAKEKNVSGIVVDAQTGKPIPHVGVFVSGTTSGCITDSLGFFNLKVPYYPCVIIADHVAYESFIKAVENNTKLHIELRSSNFSINEVSVSGKNKRKRNLRYFYSHFIRENRNKINIQNDSVLVFQRDEMRFQASTKEPLILVNNYLGYRIKVVLNEFEVIALDSPNGKQIPLNSLDGGEVMQVTGHYLYEPLENEIPEKAEYFAENRRVTYYGSYRHFLKSIYDNNPGQHGYEITVKQAKGKAVFYEIVSEKNNLNYKEFVIQADTLNVTYYFDDNKFPIPNEEVRGKFYLNTRRSTIYSTKQPFIIRPNGTSPKLTFIINGMMAMKSFANSLPEDYEPPMR